MNLQFSPEEMQLIIRGLESLPAGQSYRLLKKIEEWVEVSNKEAEKPKEE